MRYAVLFPGQGSQQPGMLPWLEAEAAAQPMLEAMDRQLGAPWRQVLADSSQVHRNAVAQVLVTGTAAAAWASLASRMPVRPVAVAGYSVGELVAAVAAGALDAVAMLHLAAQRAACMDAAVPAGDTGLLAVSGLPTQAVLQCAAARDAQLAIDLGEAQTVLAGRSETLAVLAAQLGAMGAHCTHLPITLASHSRWMRSAVRPFAGAVAGVAMARPVCPVAVNAGGGLVRDAEALRTALAGQLAQPVCWAACQDAVAERRPDRVLEVGGGEAMARLWRGRHPDVDVRSLVDFRSPEGAATWLRNA